MSLVFLATTMVMAALAVGFIVLPQRKLLKARRLTGSALPMFIIPVVAVGGYALLGSPAAMTAQPPQQKLYPNYLAQEKTPDKKSVGSVNSLLAGLEARLEREPDDAGSWLLLAKSYRHLGQPGKAREAYAKAKALGMTDDDFESDTLSASDAGVARQTAAPLPANDGPEIRGHIALSDSLAAGVSAKDTIFIFAKASSDQRMPVAAIRRPAVDLPFSFSLSDRDALMAGASMADYDTLIVSARLSRSGLATDAEGAFETRSEPVSPTGDAFVQLVLDETNRAGTSTHE